MRGEKEGREFEETSSMGSRREFNGLTYGGKCSNKLAVKQCQPLSVNDSYQPLFRWLWSDKAGMLLLPRM